MTNFLNQSPFSCFYLILLQKESIWFPARRLNENKEMMQWIFLKWVVKVPAGYKSNLWAWRCIQAPKRIKNKMFEPYDVTNFTNITHPNATDFNYTSYITISEEFTRIVSISVFISFSFIFIVGLLGNSLVVMGEQFTCVALKLFSNFFCLPTNQSWHRIQQCVRQPTSWLLIWPWLICFLWFSVSEKKRDWKEVVKRFDVDWRVQISKDTSDALTQHRTLFVG